MARIVGQKKAREIWFLCRYYTAQEALDMGLVNTVVPLDELELVRFLSVIACPEDGSKLVVIYSTFDGH